jgi:sigma-B regulation protein RsbU (phosphoserine phosphatase)
MPLVAVLFARELLDPEVSRPDNRATPKGRAEIETQCFRVVPMQDRAARVLVVDDEELNCDLLARCLDARGYEAVTVTGGREALQALAASPFDVILLDVTMPGVNGLEVLRRVRQAHSATDLPVIMTTARDASDDIVAALGLGANDYVTKPMDVSVLMARVDTQLALRRAVKQIKHLEEDLAQRNQALQAANLRMQRDLKAAAEIQKAFLPRAGALMAGVEFAWAFQPCHELAGDGLNIVPLGDRRLGLYVLDVSGHGVAPALLSIAFARVLAPPHDPASILVGNSEVPGPPVSPGEVARRLERLFAYDPATGQYTTLVYGILDAVAGEFRYVTAGHPGPVLVPAAGEPLVLEAGGFPIGVGGGSLQERTVKLAPGDRLYLYSDGISEAVDASGEAFGQERLIRALCRNRSKPLQEGIPLLLGEVERWRAGANARDDASVLAVEVPCSRRG